MKKPTLTSRLSLRRDVYEWTLSIPALWMMTTRWWKMNLCWWMMRLTWKAVEPQSEVWGEIKRVFRRGYQNWWRWTSE